MLLLTVYKLIFLFYEKNKKIHKSHAKLILKMKYVRNIVVICFFTHLCYNLFIQGKAVMELSNGITKGQERDMFRQIEELFAKVDRMEKRINELDKENKTLKIELKIKDAKIEKLEKENEQLKTEIKRLKNQNKKDSSNSNKPSGTNGFKKVITNRREKSEKNMEVNKDIKEIVYGKKN